MAELRGHFGEAAHDHSDACCGEKIGKRTLAAQMSGNNGRETKDAAADNGVDHQRREAPAAYGPYQVCGFARAHLCGLL